MKVGMARVDCNIINDNPIGADNFLAGSDLAAV